MKKMTKKEAFDKVVAYNLMDEKEYEDYVTYCEEYGYDPKNLHGKNQRQHVYAQCLVAFGRKFEFYNGDE